MKQILEERKKRGEEPWNLTQLEKATGIAREALSRRANDHIGMTPEFAVRVAPALGITADELLPPAVEPVTIANLDRRLEAVEMKLDDSIRLTTEALRLLREARKPAASASPGE